MSKRTIASSESAQPEADGGTMNVIAKGLAEHKALLYGFGVILIISTTCQVLHANFTLYLWVVFAIYLVGSMIWLITRDHVGLRRRTETGNSNTTVRIEGSEGVRRVANRTGYGSNTDLTINNSKNVEDVANDTGQQTHGSSSP
jgi:hypothetical protein